MGGAKNDNDPRFIIEKLDSQYVNMGISKISRMDNFKYCTKYLDKIYTDKIRSILENVRWCMCFIDSLTDCTFYGF